MATCKASCELGAGGEGERAGSARASGRIWLLGVRTLLVVLFR
jgi:hypothetical protein